MRPAVRRGKRHFSRELQAGLTDIGQDTALAGYCSSQLDAISGRPCGSAAQVSVPAPPS